MLRRRGKDITVLRIGLGLQQVASLIVPPEWEMADPGRFEAVMDLLRAVLPERFPLQSTLFRRDAKLSLIQMAEQQQHRLSPAPPAAPCG